MAFRFSDGKPWHDLGRMLWHRVCGGRLHWHNRVFTAGQRWEPTARGSRLVWPGRGTLDARRIDSLPRHGDTACILASGPSVGRIRDLERLFDQPVACVNGSVSLAHDLGRRVHYFIVSDHRFILEKPDLFRLGTGLADAVVLTRAAAVDAESREAIRRAVIAARAGDSSMLWAEASHRPVALRDHGGGLHDLDRIRGRRVAAFAGIGNPAAFRATLAGLGGDITTYTPFADHHAYRDADLQALADTARASHADLAITTLKDLVKVRRLDLGGIPLMALEIAATFSVGGDELAAAVLAASRPLAR